MRRILPYFIGALAGLLAAVIFAINTAIAAPLNSTGCFSDTNGHWAETFICWLKDNGIASGYGDGTYGPEDNITRAEMAVMLQRIAQVSPETGNFAIDVGPDAWRPSGSSTDHFIEYYPETAVLKSNMTGLYQFQVGVSAPSVLYNRVLYLTGAILCYSVDPERFSIDPLPPAGAEITQVSLQAFGSTNGVGGVYRSVIDNTVLQDVGCKTYTISQPLNMIPKDHVSLQLEVNFIDTTKVVNVSSVTFSFTLNPTTAKLAPLPERQQTP